MMINMLMKRFCRSLVLLLAFANIQSDVVFAQVNENLIAAKIQPMDQLISESVAQPRFNLMLLTSFASLAKVSSNLSGAGATGINSPFCNTRGLTGSQWIEIAFTADCGGCISVSNNSSFKNTLWSRIG